MVPTPLMRASGVATWSSRILSRPEALSVADAVSIIMGMSSALNLKMTGVVAPSGRTEFTMSSLSRTLLVASSISVPYSNSRVIMLTFSLLWELSFLRFSTLLREFSRSLVRLVSISDALAPWYELMTIMVLASKSGRRAMLVLISE